MANQLVHPAGDLIRYLDGELGGEEKRKIEVHLGSCAECREQISFMRDFNRRLAELNAKEIVSREPCPDARMLVRYEAGGVDAETAEHLRAHMFFCQACREDYYALRRLSREESWEELLERLKDFIIDLAKSYGLGWMVGPVRIVGEQSAFPTRGGQLPKAVGKVLEVTVGENSYSVEVTLAAAGSLSCDIAGVRTPLKEPLRVSAQSGTEAELLSVQTDKYGNTHFVIPGSEGTEILVLLTFNLKDWEQQILIRVPITSGPA